jgi:hypothetical protein
VPHAPSTSLRPISQSTRHSNRRRRCRVTERGLLHSPIAMQLQCTPPSETSQSQPPGAVHQRRDRRPRRAHMYVYVYVYVHKQLSHSPTMVSLTSTKLGRKCQKEAHRPATAKCPAPRAGGSKGRWWWWRWWW